MNTKPSTLYHTLGISILFSVVWIGKADAQVNENRVQRQASGIYKGRFSNIKRVRVVPNHSRETIRIDNSSGKMRVPVTERTVKTKLNDEDLPGSGRAKIKGDGKKAKVTRGGKKIAYSVNKGIMDTLRDGHRPIKQGTANGSMVLKGNSWIAKLGLKGKRIDNDSYTSIFTASANGKH
jgi:hypothetical protein